MTAVIRFNFPESPILLADLLLSAPPNPDREFALPTLGKTRFNWGRLQELVPSSLCQKLVLVSDDLVVAWTGNFMKAQIFFSELKARSDRESFSLNELKQYLEGLDESNWMGANSATGIGILGFFHSGDGLFHHFGHGSSAIMTRQFGWTDVLGSVIEAMPMIANQELITDQSLSSESANHPLASSLSQTIAFTGLLVRDELATKVPLQHRFGGGYEIAFFDEGRFKKLDDVVYLFWNCALEGDNVLISAAPQIMIRFSYYSDILVVRTVQLEFESEVKVIRDDVHFIRPTYRNIEPAEVAACSRPSFSTTWTCHYFGVNFGDGASEVYCKLHAEHGENPWIRFVEKTEGIEIQVNQVFLQSTAAEILQAARSRSTVSS